MTRLWPNGISMMLAAGLALSGCGSETPSNDDGNGDDDGEDAGADGAGETDADTDTDTDIDVDTDTDTDIDTDTDTDTDADGDGDWTGECRDNGDCPAGECIRLPDEEGGFWACKFAPQAEATGPSENPGEDSCTRSNQCGAGCGCYRVEEYYPGFQHPHNECRCDECSDISPCPIPALQPPDYPEPICAPAGVWDLPRNKCVYAACRVNGDCTLKPEGQCVPYFDACSMLDPGPITGKYCNYASDECRYDGVCSQESCVPDMYNNTGFSCDEPMCPG